MEVVGRHRDGGRNVSFGADTALDRVKPSVKPHPKAPTAARGEQCPPKQLGLAAPCGLLSAPRASSGFYEPGGSESH